MPALTPTRRPRRGNKRQRTPTRRNGQRRIPASKPWRDRRRRVGPPKRERERGRHGPARPRRVRHAPRQRLVAPTGKRKRISRRGCGREPPPMLASKRRSERISTRPRLMRMREWRPDPAYRRMPPRTLARRQGNTGRTSGTDRRGTPPVGGDFPGTPRRPGSRLPSDGSPFRLRRRCGAFRLCYATPHPVLAREFH